MKPLKKIEPDPNDPLWTFPYADRATMNRIVWYFEVHLPNRKEGWIQNPKTHALTRAEKKAAGNTRWPSVPARNRVRVEEWFQMMLARVKRERGVVTPGKLQSLRMNAANYGRNVLMSTKRCLNRAQYNKDKRLYLAYQEYLTKEIRKALPKTESRNLGYA